MSLLGTLQSGCLIAFAGLLLAAAWQDLRTMRIADRFSAAIAACFAVWTGAGMALGETSLAAIGPSALAGLCVFAVGIVAFAAGAVGGGDVKLLSATSLFAGPNLLPDLVLATALAGSAMAIGMLTGVPIGPGVPERGALGTRLHGNLPFGPAIAVGGLWVAASLA